MDSGLQMPIILASTSPRRLYLMSQVHLNVEVQAPQVDEKPKPREKPQSLVSRLALEKAQSVCEIAIQRYEKSLVIAADTIVVSPNGKKILGKPNDVSDAKKTLKMLADKTHLVLTGYCLLLATRGATPKKLTRVVRSKVKIRALTPAMIERYVASGEPMDKAGSYAAQGMGMALIERIDGSYTNVVGLPMSQILMDIEKLCKVPLFSWTNA